MRPVVDPHHEPVRLARPCVPQLEGNRRIAALMLADLPSVEPGGGTPIRGAEHDEHPAAAPRGRNGERASVPADVTAVGNAGKRRTPGERHENLSACRAGKALRPSGALALV